MIRQGLYFLVFFISLIILSACATEVPPPTKTLYDRLGGKKAIQLVVNDFINTVGNDTRITNQKVADRLASIDIAKLKELVTEQVCMATGGPCVYSGRTMKASHAGLEITLAEFNYVVDDLVKTLNAYKVPNPEQQELLALLAPMKPDIVEVPN